WEAPSSNPPHFHPLPQAWLLLGSLPRIGKAPPPCPAAAPRSAAPRRFPEAASPTVPAPLPPNSPPPRHAAIRSIAKSGHRSGSCQLLLGNRVEHTVMQHLLDPHQRLVAGLQ